MDMNPKLSKRTISAVQRIITGEAAEKEKPLSPYRSGPALVVLFNEYGFNDSYPSGGGFPSRWMYAEGKLSELNGTAVIARVVEMAVDPAFFLGTEFSVEKAVEYLNTYLEFEGFVLSPAGKKYKLRVFGEPTIAVETPLEPQQRVSHEFITEQIEKCDRKLSQEDYDGAITSARSLVEGVLRDIETRLDENAPAYDGDLVKLYKRVQRLLNLDPNRPDLTESIQQLLRGLISTITGLAALRNKMSDAHVRTYKPARHHAKLAINSAKTFLDFIYDTFEYQKARGVVTEIQKPKEEVWW